MGELYPISTIPADKQSCLFNDDDVNDDDDHDDDSDVVQGLTSLTSISIRQTGLLLPATTDQQHHHDGHHGHHQHYHHIIIREILVDPQKYCILGISLDG